ncbi:MAG: FAD/NAD(P)-binding oxidoreductase [Actinomycetota bacterium]|nr:FAD/NAD(P)-binding oxidoreductase [Actinomycetota bacterium]
MYKKELYKKIVVIGGNVAGLAAASQAKRVYPEAEVTVLESGQYISYGSCGLPYYVTGEIKDFEQIFVYFDFLKERDIRILLNHKVTRLDTTNKQAIVNDGQAIGYDRLIICSSPGAH